MYTVVNILNDTPVNPDLLNSSLRENVCTCYAHQYYILLLRLAFQFQLKSCHNRIWWRTHATWAPEVPTSAQHE